MYFHFCITSKARNLLLASTTNLHPTYQEEWTFFLTQPQKLAHQLSIVQDHIRKQQLIPSTNMEDS